MRVLRVPARQFLKERLAWVVLKAAQTHKREAEELRVEAMRPAQLTVWARIRFCFLVLTRETVLAWPVFHDHRPLPVFAGHR